MARNRTNRPIDPLPTKPLDPVAALALIRAELQREAEIPEAGYLTSQHWAEAWKLTNQHTSRLLNSGLKSGIVQRKEYRIKCGTYVRKVPHFRVVGKPA